MKTTEMIAAAVGSDIGYPLFFKKAKEILDYFLTKKSNLINSLEPTVSLYIMICKYLTKRTFLAT